MQDTVIDKIKSKTNQDRLGFVSEAALKAVMELNEEAHKNGTAGMPDYMVAEEIAEYRASKRNG